MNMGMLKVKKKKKRCCKKNKTLFIPEKILKPCLCGKGYYRVSLRKGNKTYEKYIHQLVALHFVSNPLNYTVVNHIDGNKINNYYKNLEWVTYSQNNQHAYNTGLKNRGEKFYNSKLTEENVCEILSKGKYTSYQKIADKYMVFQKQLLEIFY